jgi:hypothetical protein
MERINSECKTKRPGLSPGPASRKLLLRLK